LRAVVKVHSQRQTGPEVTRKDRSLIISLGSDAKHVLEVVRSHWSIENELQGKGLMAGWEEAYLLKILSGLF
jgi:hypothetical protein